MNRWKKRFNILLMTLLVIVGSVESLFVITDWHFLWPLTHLRTSPAAAVFHWPEIVSAVQFEFEYEDGTHSYFDVDAKNFAQLDGPMVRRIIYLGPVIRNFPEAAWSPIYRFGLCHGGPIAQAFQIAKPIRVATLHTRSRSPQIRLRDKNLVVECR